MQHSRIGRCAVSTRDLMNNTHARLVRVLFRHWHFCSAGSPARSEHREFRCRSFNSGDDSGLSCTYTSCWDDWMIGRPIWYMSVSGEQTSFLWPGLWHTCSQILVSTSSALLFSEGSG